MGANGAGKSTLVKIITGVFPADGGQIAVKGVVRSFRSPAEARSAGIVSVYQDPALVPDLTIAQNMRLAGASVDAVRKWLAELGVVRLDFSLLVRDLPDPTLRLIDLARALSWEPAVLLLDEITASLPADLSEQIYAMVKRWRERGNAVIFISHRMAEVSALCDRATVLRDGVTVRCDRACARQRGAHRRAHVGGRDGPSGRVSDLRRAPLAKRPRDAQAALEVRGLRCSPAAQRCFVQTLSGRGSGGGGVGGPGAGGTVRLHRRQSPLRRRRHLRARQRIEAPPPSGCHSGRYRARASEPIVGSPAATADSQKISPCRPSAAFGIGVRSGCARSECA